MTIELKRKNTLVSLLSAGSQAVASQTDVRMGQSPNTQGHQAAISVSQPGLSAGQISTESASLCTTYAQVRGHSYNSIKVKELCNDTVVDWLDENRHPGIARAIESCGRSFAHFEDDHGHKKYVRVYCNNEICPTCGKDRSKVHLKRTHRAFPRLSWSDVLGYWVFTLPSEVSADMPDKKVLGKLEKAAWEIVKKNFNTPGCVSRIHLMGEKTPGKLHIHINILFPVFNANKKGKVSSEVVEKTKKDWTEYVNKTFKLSYEKIDSKYQFAYKPGQKYHKVRYILRPIVSARLFLTLSDADKERVLSLRGWHNTRWFGELCNSKWKKYLTSRGIDIEALQKLDEKNDLLSCPICGDRYRYIKTEALPKGQIIWIDDDVAIDRESYWIMRRKGGG